MSEFEQPLYPLILHSIPVLDRGVPNRECVALRATQTVDLANYAIFVGIKMASGKAIPVIDHFFWFGNNIIQRDDWVFVYTRNGTKSYEPITDRPANKLLRLYWARTTVLFQNADVVPVVIRMEDIQIGHVPLQKPALL
jgi:hypothetical protein